MKIILQILLLSFLMIALGSSDLKAQNSASASFTVSVNIVEPIQIQRTSDMNFADVDAKNGGSVTLNPDNTRFASGGAILKGSGAVSAATFEVKGQKGYTFSIDIPTQEVLMTNGNQEIIIKEITSDQKSHMLNEDSQIIRMGATIKLQPNQEPGLYTTSTPIAVTVSYN